jgi:hypothetical protein
MDVLEKGEISCAPVRNQTIPQFYFFAKKSMFTIHTTLFILILISHANKAKRSTNHGHLQDIQSKKKVEKLQLP